MAIHIALSLALAGSIALAFILLRWSDSVAGARLLAVFLCGVAVWIAGNELPTWLGPDAERPALMLLATAALTAAVFCHFALVFAGVRTTRLALGMIYATALSATLASVAIPSGSFQPFAGVARLAIPNTVGWATSAVWALLAASGQAVLMRAFVARTGLARRQVGAVIASSAWGLLCMSGYAIAALRLPIYPWPLLLLPAYPLILVYGILRYRVFVANAWARRGLVWAMLTSLALLVLALTPFLPLPFTQGRLVSGMLTAALCLAVAGPARRLASRIVYPGGTVSADDLAAWRAALGQADTQDSLAQKAAAILSQRLRLAVRVTVGPDLGDAGPAGPNPSLHCHRIGPAWQTDLAGWDAAPPGSRYLAGLFGTVLAEEAARLERAAQLAEREREAQTQARLAELGQLAASVAHDLRNPLNVIAMAAAAAPPEARQEIRVQIDRISHLSRDLLDYAKPWHPERVALDLAAQARQCAGRFPGVAIGPGLDQPLPLHADPRRLDQALTNLLANACATGARVAMDAEATPSLIHLHVCDTGPGVPADLRHRIFQPFVSRGTGGTGLGLAIVARIMAAHGGSAGLTDRPGWTTCFTLSFPREFASEAAP